jgi:hypothetical protein
MTVMISRLSLTLINSKDTRDGSSVLKDNPLRVGEMSLCLGVVGNLTVATMLSMLGKWLCDLRRQVWDS